ncbi:MAG: ABC transporter ATP-binding protein [Cytophagales bacterium]|nr:MAG: ABC transporter ATP-binding protein [Cytophagales bacterium]
MALENEIDDDTLLEATNLVVKFATERGEHTAIDGVSFKIKKGETVGIVGESGSGKSVSALSLMRLIPDPPGKVIDGEVMFQSPSMGKVDIMQLGNQQMRSLRGGEIAMIFQEPMSSLNPVFTCGEQITEAILLHEVGMNYKGAKARTLAIFERVRLPHSAFLAYPHELSGGQKQRVMIAMALSCQPSLLIADEPTTALDVTVQREILQILQELRESQEMSILFITHDLGVIAEMADSVMVMYNGKIVEKGSVFEIFSNPKHPYTKGLLACRPRLDIKLKVLPVVKDFMETDSNGNIVEMSEAKFKSVGQAIMSNFQSLQEIKAKQGRIVAQEPILQVRDLKVHFPQEKNWLGKATKIKKAVDGVTFDVYPGETLGLVGESGCGKTTLGRSILHLIQPTSGEVIFQGRDISKISSTKEMRELRKDIQIVFQDPYSSLNPRITIGEAIIEPMRLHKIGSNDKERKDKVIHLLETVNLSGMYFNRYPHEFSGGQRQRICIARTLAIEPKFVICDESVSALDVSVQAQVLNLLNKLKEEYNLTYIFISHDLSVIKFISDRILVMQEGLIVEEGFADEIYSQPKSNYTKKLLEAIPKGTPEDIRKSMLRRKKQNQKPAPNQPAGE